MLQFHSGECMYIQSYCFWKRIYLNLSSESELWFHWMWNAWIMVQAYAIIFSFKITIRVSFSIWILGKCSLNGCRGLVHCTIVRLCIRINNIHTLFIRTHARTLHAVNGKSLFIYLVVVVCRMSEHCIVVLINGFVFMNPVCVCQW